MTDLNRSTIAQANATADASPEARGMDGLLATKLFVPRVQPGFVVRPRLLAQLDTGLARGIILVSAPAGFGKTVLLADWVRRGDGPVAWLSLDSGDNDPVRFWRHVAAALDRAVPGAADRVAPLLESAGPWFDGLVATLINEVADHPGEVLLVLDDLHLISSPPMLASLTLLLSYLPPNLRLVLASRSDPPVPLASLRAGGQLAEVRPADLRFTAEESGVLLRAAARADLPGSVTAALADQTEGWAAGLHLAALSLQESADPASVVATFSGAHRHVFDYLTEAVLDRQTGPVREFLLETSVLDRLSGPLCDAVTGRADGQQMLEAIERANLFLVPLDEVRGWWRYHHLFADVLQARLQQERPARAPHLHRAAARWHDGHGLMNDAIRHALDASDPALAARLIERHFDALVLRGEGATVQRWLALLPAEMTGARPRLLLAQARLALLSGRPEGVAGLLDAAEHAFAATADPPFVSSAGPAASLLNNPAATIALARGILAELRGDPEDASDYAAKALTRINPGEVALETITRGHLAVADWLRGRVSDAERSFTAQIAQFEAAGEINLAAWSSHYLGQVQRAQGRLDAATATYEHALTVATSPGRPLVPASGVALVGLAEIAYQRGEHDLALRHVTGGIALCRQLVYTQPLANGLATLAWIAWATGDATGAQAVIEDAMHAAPSPAVTNLLNTVPARRARLQLAQGNLAAAAAWIRARGLRPGDDPGYSQEPEYLVLARVLLAQNQAAGALRLLDRMHGLAITQGRTGSVIEIQALRALALTLSGDDPAAVHTLSQALTLAAPQGYVRVFAGEGASMANLLSRVTAAQRTAPPAARLPLGYLSRLLRAAARAETSRTPGQEAAPGAGPGPLVALSEREQDVLRLLATGKKNREIASELYVAIDTVKKHITHIFTKLGATNRTEAIVRARDLGLLP